MMVAPSYHNTEQTASAPSPATKPSWRFGGLSAAELMPKLQRHLLENRLLERHLLEKSIEANWQLVWLNNNGRPVIGLLPKTSWFVYCCANDYSILSGQTTAYKVVKHSRDVDKDSHFDSQNDSGAITTAQMSYVEWQDELIAYSQAYDIDAYDADSSDSNLTISSDNQPNYHHGLIGFIGYDIAAHELSPTSNIELAAQQPCAALGHYDIYLTPNKGKKGWELTVNTLSNDSDKNTNHHNKNKLVAALIDYLNELDSKLPHIDTTKDTNVQLPSLKLEAKWHKNDYQRAFKQTQDYLQQGDCYQINLTQEWHGQLAYKNTQLTSNLIDYLPALHTNTQAPFAGYVAVNDFNGSFDNDILASQFELLSCSPELFFTFTKDNNTGKHHIITKPIKGTMPRGATVKLDNDYKQQLINSEKDRAENVMIVDLLRNDLGKYAKIGSVKVPQLFAIESFSNVHHMVSTISAELRTDTHPLAVLFGSLPAGSITGTPKKRAVEIISELEIAPRGAYCGTMGYMNFDGSGQWNVLIRTLQANHLSSDTANNTKQVSLWAGGGITVSSDCDAEYQECLDKVGNLLAVLQEHFSA